MRAGTRSWSRVVVAPTIVARALAPMRTDGVVGSAVPVMVTSVPPSTETVFGLSDVIPKSPIEG